MSGRIFASEKHDPGLRDIFDCAEKERAKQGDEKMRNVIVHPNDNGIVTSDHPDTHPCSDHLFEISCYYNIEDRKRNYCLVIEDMENGYKDYINHCIPAVKNLIDFFRKMKVRFNFFLLKQKSEYFFPKVAANWSQILQTILIIDVCLWSLENGMKEIFFWQVGSEN